MRTSHLFTVGAVLLLTLGGCGKPSNMPGDDCASNPAKCGCSDDNQCADPTPRCDTRVKGCVPCLPTTDNCAPGTHCVNDGKKYSCVDKDRCIQGADCPPAGNKPGLCCDGKCADPLNDTANCGSCGNACGAVAYGKAGCIAGVCGVASCDAGFGDCDKKPTNGCEADLRADVTHCGSCETPCKKAPNTTVACQSSQCAWTCVAGFDDCDAMTANGCETSTTTNGQNCGGCGKVCGMLPNADSVTCSNSVCVPETCAPRFKDCNLKPGDGCEVDLDSDPLNCSGCGRKCPPVDHGAAGCSMSACGVGKCDKGFGDCDGNVLNGCEQDLTTDVKNCGVCGNVCMLPNAVPGCQAGVCGLQACNQNFADCDVNAANGCEVSTANDAKNCGACGKVCPVPPNATARCSFGVCGVGSCMAGWADCNNNSNDGCETNIYQVNDCGGCGSACGVPANGVAACPKGVCAIGMCNVGFGDCDMKVFTGCEVNLTADGNNCGMCGVVCVPKFNQVGSCVAGKCTLGACLQGFVDCNKNLVDGCEVDVRSDGKNCGACGNVCPMNAPFCTGGQCNNILKSCLEYSKGGGQQSGIFTVDPDGGGPIQPFQVYCDMTMDGGGWTLALSRKVDDAFPGISGKSLTWNCLTPGAAPLSTQDHSPSVLHYDMFTAINPSDMMLMGGKRIIKFMFARPGGVAFTINYRYLTERTCYEAMSIYDANNTGGTRSGCGHTNDACVTTDFALWKVHDMGPAGCFHDATNSQVDTNYCMGQNCGTWGICPGGAQNMPPGAPNCWFWGGTNACGMPNITACPGPSQAAWADYTVGTMSGYYNLWIR